LVALYFKGFGHIHLENSQKTPISVNAAASIYPKMHQKEQRQHTDESIPEDTHDDN
jgi:hypothetical protein